MIIKPADRASEVAQDAEPQMPHVQQDRPRGVSAASPEAAPARKWHWIRWLTLLAVFVVAWNYRAHWIPWVAAARMNGHGPPAQGARPIPVRTAKVDERDLDLFLNGLGTVTAFKTVTLRSRVDGELVKVAFTEGQMVREGDLLAQIDPRPFEAQLAQAEGTLAKDEATLKLAKLTLTRGQELLRTKSIAQQQLDEESAQVQQIEGTVKTDQGLVDNAKLQLSYCRIVSPISGRIGLRLVDQGNIVHANDLMGMAVITQLQPIAVVFPISQDEIPRVQKRTLQKADLKVDAFDRDFKTKLATGKLYAIDNQVDSTTGTVRLKAVFDNEDGMLFPNQFVNARLLVDTMHNAVVVPSAAVQRGPTSTFVYVVQPAEKGEKVKRRDIVTGPAEGADTSIKTGLVPGEIVVTDGLDKLKDDASVTTREPEKEKGPGGPNRQAGSPQTNETAIHPIEAKAEGKKGTK